MSSDAAIADAPPASRAVRAVALLGPIAAVVGVVAHDLWRVLPAERFALSLVLAGVALLVAWPLRRVLRCSTAAAVALAWTLALVVYVGPLPALAAATLGATALAIGLRVMPVARSGRIAIACAVGLVAIAGLCGWLVTWPIFRPWLWWPLSLAIILWRRRDLHDAIRDALSGARAAVADAPRAATCVVLLLGLASTACWIPAMQIDDIAYHLNLPTQLMLHGRYAPQPEHQVWAFAPWAGDVLQGIVFVLARGEAHGAMNALWLLLAAGAAWSMAAGLGASTRERWAAVALFASLPPLVWIAAGMQTELAATAVLLALAAVVVAPGEGGAHRGRLVAGAALFAGLFALKLVHGLSALPLLVYAAWRHGISARGIAIALMIFFALALSSYAQSWLATGNPLLPMFNDVFRSPFFPTAQYRDARWFAGFDLALPWRMTFDTDRYVEAWDGGLGLSLIALAGVWAWSLCRSGARAFALAATAVLLLPLIPMQYARYAYPGLALFCVALPVGLRARIGARAFAWLIAGVCVANLAYQANASWLHHSAAIKRTIRAIGDDDAVLRRYSPERILARRIPDTPADLLLATDPYRSVVATLAGRGRTVGQHDPDLAGAAEAADRDLSGRAWAALFARERIRWTMLTASRASPALRAGLRASGARLDARIDDAELWRLPDADANASDGHTDTADEASP